MKNEHKKGRYYLSSYDDKVVKLICPKRYKGKVMWRVRSRPEKASPEYCDRRHMADGAITYLLCEKYLKEEIPKIRGVLLV